MAFLKVLIYNVIFIVATASFIDKYLPDKSEMNIISKHYDINFALYTGDDIFYGECNISIKIYSETQNIYLYTENLGITEVMLTNVYNDVQRSEKNVEKVFAHKFEKLIYDAKTHITIISFPYNLSSKSYILNMKFIGFLIENGSFKTYFMDQQNDRK